MEGVALGMVGPAWEWALCALPGDGSAGDSGRLLDLVRLEDPSTSLRQLGPGLGVGVEHGEVGDDDRDGEGDGEDARERADAPHQHPHRRLGHHVPEADGAHRAETHHFPPGPHHLATDWVGRKEGTTQIQLRTAN